MPKILTNFVKHSDYTGCYIVQRENLKITIPSKIMSQGEKYSASFSVEEGAYITDLLIKTSLDNVWRQGNLRQILKGGNEYGDISLFTYLRRTSKKEYTLEVSASVFGGGNSNNPTPRIDLEGRVVLSKIPGY